MPEGDIVDDTAGDCSYEEFLIARLPRRFIKKVLKKYVDFTQVVHFSSMFSAISAATSTNYVKSMKNADYPTVGTKKALHTVKL